MKQKEKNVSPMSNEGRNAYVTEHLTEACLKLLQDKPLGAISVSELCEEAGVGRASFYRNFESKEDILRTHLHRLFSGWADGCLNGEDRPLSEWIGSLFDHFERHREFYALLNRQNLIYLLKDMILERNELTLECSAREAYAKAFVSYALYGWIEVWFQRGMKESAEEMKRLFEEQGL